MSKKLLLFIIVMKLLIISVFAERIETEKITISNDFVVVSNLTAGSLTIGGETITNIYPTYPAFKLELGGAWTDFELKASTNNFADAAGMVYYYISSFNNTYADDTNVIVYFSDDYQPDVRKWVTATNNTAIYNQLVSKGSSVVDYIYVYPSHDGTNFPWRSWMSKTNTHLIWSYVRFDGVNFEMNEIGSLQHWNLIRPDSWEVERTTP